MKARRIALTLVLCFTAAASCAASDAAMGTWKLNEAKSKFPPGATKNQTVIYEAAGDQVKVTVQGTTADGKAVQSEWTGKFDGKFYPLTGDPNADQRAYKQVNDRTLEITSKKGDKVVSTTRVEIARDGKSRTVTSNATDSMGKTTKIVAVYDKQ